MRRLLLLSIICVLATGCTDWLVEDQSVAFLPTLTPSLPPELEPTATPLPDAPPPPTPTPEPTPEPGSGDLAVAYFAASPEEVIPGETFQLFWNTQGGDSAAVYRLNEDNTPGETWAVELEGTLNVTAAEGGQETYVLTVTNGVSTVEAEVVIFVDCAVGWFFTPEPEDGCPDASVISTQARTQQFEFGRMFWLEETNQILVLFNTPPDQIDEENPAWLRFSETYIEGEPIEDPAIEPPEGLFEPERGFGKVWRENQQVRDRLGWAVTPEFEYVALFQTTTLETFTQIYFSDETTSVFTILPPEDGWQVVGRVQ